MEDKSIYITDGDHGNVENKPSFYQYKDVKENGDPRSPVIRSPQRTTIFRNTCAGEQIREGKERDGLLYRATRNKFCAFLVRTCLSKEAKPGIARGLR